MALESLWSWVLGWVTLLMILGMISTHSKKTLLELKDSSQVDIREKDNSGEDGEAVDIFQLLLTLINTLLIFITTYSLWT